MFRLVLAVVVAAVLVSGCTSRSNGRAGDTSYIGTPMAASPSSRPTGFAMPNEVGKSLPAAQDDLQKVSGNPIFISHSTDESGAGRHQVLDRDWKVCTQSPPSGTMITATGYVTFGAVKLVESCP